MQNKIDYLIGTMVTIKADATATGTTIISREVAQHIIDVLYLISDELGDISEELTKI